MKRLKLLQRDLRHAEARQAELEDSNALLRRQMTEAETNAEQTTSVLTARVEQLSSQLDTTLCQLHQLQVGYTSDICRPTSRRDYA